MAKKVILYTLTLILLLTTLFGFMPAKEVKAVEPDNWNHVIPFTITDTSGVARTNVPVIISYDINGKLIAYGLTNATCTNTYLDSSGASNSPIGSGTAYSYLMATSNITAVIPSLPAYGSVTLNLYTGYSPVQTSFPIITGNGGNVTFADNDAIELSNNFTIQVSPYLSESGNIIVKDDALALTYDLATQNVTASILDTYEVTAMRIRMKPATGQYCRIYGGYFNETVSPTSSTDGGAVWSDDALAYDNNLTTHSQSTAKIAAGVWSDYLQLNHAALATENVTVKLALGVSGAFDADIDVYYDSAWHDVYSGAYTDGNTTTYTIPVQASVTAILVAVGEHNVVFRGDGNVIESIIDPIDNNLVFNSDFEVGNPPSSWTNYAGYLTVTQNSTQHHTGTYSVALTRGASDGYIYQYITGYSNYINLDMTFGCWAYATQANRARLLIYDGVDGVYSSYHSGVAGWEWLTCTYKIAAIANYIRLDARASGGAATVHYDGAKLVVGTTCTPDTTPPTTAVGADIPNNNNNWVLGSNATPKINYYKHTIAGIEKIWYQPQAVISGTTLPNRDSGGLYPGTIGWGTNSGITVTGGSIMDSESATSVGVTSAMMQGELFHIGTYTSVYLSFQYGLNTNYGYSTSEATATVAQTHTVSLTGLTPNTTYHYRAIARSGSVYSYGADTTFTTSYSTSSAGSTTPLIQKAGVFSSYKSAGDWLFAAEIVLTYLPYYPAGTPSQYFQIQLVGLDGTTIIGASSIKQWGDRPASIYLNSGANITNQSAYVIKVTNISSANITISANYTLTASDWHGTNMEELDWWCRGIAKSMEINDGMTLTNPYVVSTTTYGLIITSTAGGYFTAGIPNIEQVRPNLFGLSKQPMELPNLTSNINYNTGSTTIAGKVGTTITTDAQTVADVFNISGDNLLLYIIMAVVLFCVIYVISQTQGFGALGATVLTVPIVAASIYFNIVSISLIVVIAAFFVIAWVRQWWIKST